MENIDTTLINAIKIGQLVCKLNPKNQSYISGTANALLFSQNVGKEDEQKKNYDKKLL